MQAPLEGFQPQTRAVTLHQAVPEVVWFVFHRLSALQEVPWKDAVLLELISAARSPRGHFPMPCRISQAQAAGTSWAREQSQPEKGMEENG